MRKFIIVVVFLVIGCMPNYSSGERMGIVTKLSLKGIIFKSYEGELLIALPSAEAGNIHPEKFLFSTNSPEVAEKIKQAMISGKRVELRYKQWLLAPPTIDTKFIVVGVK